jgi:hypothetical protein
MISLSTVSVTTTDPVELFSVDVPSNLAFTFYGAPGAWETPQISANADGSDSAGFEINQMTDVAGTGYLQVTEQWLPLTVLVVAWNTD